MGAGGRAACPCPLMMRHACCDAAVLPAHYRRCHLRSGTGAGALRHRQALPQLWLWRCAAAWWCGQPLLCAQRQPGQPRGGRGAGYPGCVQVRRGELCKLLGQKLVLCAAPGWALVEWHAPRTCVGLPAGTRCRRCACRAPRFLHPSSTRRPRCEGLVLQVGPTRADVTPSLMPADTCPPTCRRSRRSPAPGPSSSC